MARPSKFTADRRERFLVALRAGVFPETAARHAGWSPATLYRILRGTSAAHVAFIDDVRRVETELELRLAGTVTQAAFSDPRLALSLLERRFGERWGRRAGLLVGAPATRTDAGADGSVVIVEPAVVEAVLPVLLAERLGPAGSPDAMRRVSQFAIGPGAEPDE